MGPGQWTILINTKTTKTCKLYSNYSGTSCKRIWQNKIAFLVCLRKRKGFTQTLGKNIKARNLYNKSQACSRLYILPLTFIQVSVFYFPLQAIDEASRFDHRRSRGPSLMDDKGRLEFSSFQGNKYNKNWHELFYCTAITASVDEQEHYVKDVVRTLQRVSAYFIIVCTLCSCCWFCLYSCL